MTLDELAITPEIDRGHHLRTNLSLPIEDRLTYEQHVGEANWSHKYEFAKTILEETYNKLGITAPEPEECPQMNLEDINDSEPAEVALV